MLNMTNFKLDAFIQNVYCELRDSLLVKNFYNTDR